LKNEGETIVRLNKKRFMTGVLVAMIAGTGAAEKRVLEASKDNFGRSNKRNRNSGRSEQLYVAHAPNVRSIVSFDLSGITNQITGAEFRFRQHNSMPEKISLLIAPMAHTASNTKWLEGQGNLGANGQNSRPGDSCYAFCAFSNVPWESAAGDPMRDLGDSRLWLKPLAALNGLRWEEDRWIRVSVHNTGLLEKIRTSDYPVFTIGLWGNSGQGLYAISSRESSWAPVLELQLKQER
jgi:hypothetical protein